MVMFRQFILHFLKHLGKGGDSGKLIALEIIGF